MTDVYTQDTDDQEGKQMSARKQREAATLRNRIAEERRWIAEHGGSRAGYVNRYGSAQDAEHYGDGGEAIHAADAAYLARLEARLSEATK